MYDNQNISFIEDVSSNNDSITNIQNNSLGQITNEQDDKQNNFSNFEQIDDYIRELPSWDINPPLEINRSEQ